MGLFNVLFASSYGKDKPPFFIWYPKGTSAKEKKLLFKIDFFILTYGCFAYFTKWLDQANLSNAYVSGMKEDLAMYGTQYNLAVTCFQIGTILGGIPSNLLLTWIPPRYLLPGMELIWAVLTICTYKVTSYNQVCHARILVNALKSNVDGVHSSILFASSSASLKDLLLWGSSSSSVHGTNVQSLENVPPFSPVQHTSAQ